jgi:glycosyltransferase involved in cell wall biosynthesis
MAKPLLVYVITTLGDGGAEREVARVTRVLQERSPFDVEICCLMGRGSFADETEKAGVKVTVLYEDKKPWYVTACALMGYLRQRRPVIAHVHLVRWGAIIAKLAGVPAVVFSVHNWMPRQTWLEKINARFADRVIGVSEAVSRQLVEEYGIPEKRVCTVMPALDFSQCPDTDVDAKKAELGIPFDASVIGTVGRLCEQKAQRYFIDAAAKVLKTRPECRFLILGEGPLRGELQRQIDDLGIADRVRLLGFRDDAREIIRVMDVSCLSSLHEGTPMVALEAMGYGKPVVVTAVPGSEEVVVDGETGFVVPPKDSASLAERILRLVEDRELAGRMGEAGRRLVISKYSVESNLGRLLPLYQGVLKEKGLEMPEMVGGDF